VQHGQRRHRPFLRQLRRIADSAIAGSATIFGSARCVVGGRLRERSRQRLPRLWDALHPRRGVLQRLRRAASGAQIDLTPHGGEVGGVSRRHARLMLRNGQWLIEDLNSTNFTFVNNQRLAPGAPLALKDGDQIRMGRVVLAFYSM